MENETNLLLNGLRSSLPPCLPPSRRSFHPPKVDAELGVDEEAARCLTLAVPSSALPFSLETWREGRHDTPIGER